MGAPSAPSLLVGDQRSRIASRAGGSGGASAPAPRRLLLVLLLCILSAGCRLQLDVNVEVAEDGSGAVEVVVGVDRDGTERIGGDLGAVLAIDDLEDAGWRVEGPDDEADGFTRVRFRKPFDDPEGASAIFEEIAGQEGPFQDFAVSHESSFARTEWGFRGRVDFSGGLEAFSDDDLAAALDGEPLGQTVEEIEEQLGEALSRIIQVRVGVRLPGDVTSNATTKAENGALWQVGFGDGTVDMEANGEETRTASVVGIGVAIVCAVLLLVYGLVRLAGRSLRRRRVMSSHDGPT